MNADTLVHDIEYLGSSGVILSVEQKAALTTSLPILKSQYRYKKVVFWGKILGVKDDYFIAQGIGADEIKEKQTLYSKDCVHWALLESVEKEVRENAKQVKGRFTGDPSFEFEYQPARKEVEDENAAPPEDEPAILVKEEHRLAAMIAEIDDATHCVPRGALVRTPNGQVIPNRMFEGLSVNEGSKLSSYLHAALSEGEQENNLNRADFDKAFDFLPRLDEDVPTESWSLQFERGDAVAVLRSLLWPGAIAFHVPKTKICGYVYWGLGEVNKDLLFML